MKQLINFLPLLVFFACYKFYDIYTATLALMLASAVQIALLKLIYRQVEIMHWVGFAFILLFGSLTYFLHDDVFLKWKVTIINGLFAAVLMGGELFKRPIIKQMLGQQIPLPSEVWRRVTWLWIGYFITCACLNLWVAFTMSQDIWVNFKVFGLMGLSLVMTAITIGYIYKHLPNNK
jgi:intracellular septation protein